MLYPAWHSYLASDPPTVEAGQALACMVAMLGKACRSGGQPRPCLSEESKSCTEAGMVEVASWGSPRHW